MLTKEERKAIRAQEKEYRRQVRSKPEPLEQEKSAVSPEKKEKRPDEPPNKKMARQKQKVTAEAKKILSVFPIRDYQDGFFLTVDDRIIDLFQVQGRSYYDASDDEIDAVVDDFAKFFRRYNADMKIISMNYPTNTKMQQAFLTYKLKQPELEKYEDILQEKLADLQTLEKTTTDREAFIMLFASNRDQYEMLCKLLEKIKAFSVKTISREKKENVIFQLNNMNKVVKI